MHVLCSVMSLQTSRSANLAKYSGWYSLVSLQTLVVCVLKSLLDFAEVKRMYCNRRSLLGIDELFDYLIKCPKYSQQYIVSRFIVSSFQMKFRCTAVVPMLHLYCRMRVDDYEHDLSIPSAHRLVAFHVDLLPWKLR